MSEISYIMESLLKLSEDPGHLVTALEYACAITLLIAMLSDSVLRRKRLARQKSPVQDRDKIVRK